jgi:hypothetical protein
MRRRDFIKSIAGSAVCDGHVKSRRNSMGVWPVIFRKATLKELVSAFGGKAGIRVQRSNVRL